MTKNSTAMLVCAGLFLAGACLLLSDAQIVGRPTTPPRLPEGQPSAQNSLKNRVAVGLTLHEPKSQIQLASAEDGVSEDSTTAWPSQRVSDVPIISAQGRPIIQQLLAHQPKPTAIISPAKQARSVLGTDSEPPIPDLQTSGLDSLTEQDRVILANLPAICTSDLPGPDLKRQDEGISLTMLQAANSSAGDRVNSKSSVVRSKPLMNSTAQQAEQALINAVIEQASSPRPVSSTPASGGPDLVGEDRIAHLAALNPHSTSAIASGPQQPSDGADPHFELYSRSPFPSATECAQCHQQIYDEWASSSHAYASISPMFHAFEDTINKLSQGTIGYFCLRCHAPVATTMGLRRDQAIWDGPRVFREGVTCVVCHRVKSIYTKSNGERRIEPGDLYAPVYGSGSGESVEIANKYAQFFKFKTDPNDTSPGQPIHRQAIEYEELKESSYCMSCHHVQVKPGIKLEVVWDQYRASPAYRDGVSCQDCHMGKVPGVNAGYSVGPAAVFEGKTVDPERRHSNHIFYGPGYSIAHPGIFPDDPKADRWTVNQWLEFDWRGGWGTDPFEEALAAGSITVHFPEVWQQADDRYDAREIVDRNLKKLEYKKDLRRQVLENGCKLDGPFFSASPLRNQNLTFRYCLTSLNSGHNLPSGSLGAQPQIWMNVVLIDPAGNRVWESGYLDSNGDLADRHSAEVLARNIAYDSQLMNLQTRFITTNVKGTDREMYLPINLDFDQLPFLRPATQPVSLLNHPPNIRMEAHSIPPLGSRNVKYSIPRHLIQQPGTYRLSVRLRSRAEPIYFMKFCGSTPEMIRSMNEWIADFHVQSVMFEVR
jgi:hypothetical protein